MARMLALAVLAALSAVPARADDAELQAAVDSLTPAKRESAGDWIEVSFKDELDRPLSLWCHGRKECGPLPAFSADDAAAKLLFELKLNYKQTEGSAGVVAYFNSVLSEYSAMRNASGPMFTIVKKGASLKLSGDYAASNEVHYPPFHFDPRASYPDGSRGTITLPAPEMTVKRDYDQLVVSAPAIHSAGAPNPMDGMDRKPQCPDFIPYFYGRDGSVLLPAQVLHRRLTPQEIEFTVAGIGSNLTDLGYQKAIDDSNDGRVGGVDDFVKRLRAAVRTAAGRPQAPAVSPYDKRFGAFEAAFLTCRTTYAGVGAQFFGSMRGLRPDQQAAFVSRWRSYVAREEKIYYDGSADGKIPNGPVRYQAAFDLLNERTRAMINGDGNSSSGSTGGATRPPDDSGSPLDKIR